MAMRLPQVCGDVASELEDVGGRVVYLVFAASREALVQVVWLPLLWLISRLIPSIAAIRSTCARARNDGSRCGVVV